MDDNVFIIFHIPKTAGTSLRGSLYYYYENDLDLIYFYYELYGGKPNSRPLVMDEKAKKAKYFMGHLVYYGMHNVIGKPAKYIVFLRDPIKRFISLFYHICIDNKRQGLKVPTFEEWFSVYYTQTMTNHLSRCTPFVTPALETAKHVLELSSFIGTSETFKNDIERLFYTGTKIFHDNVAKVNAGDAKMTLPRISDENMKVMNEVLDDDKELYNYALQLRARGHNKDFKLVV